MLTITTNSGFPQRMAVYLKEMYPLTQRIPMALIIAASVLLFTRHIHGWNSAMHGAPLPALLAAGSCCVFVFLLLLRLMDELKDLDIDRELFRDRPLPSGRVRERDIRISMTLVTAAYILLHAAWPLALASALGLLAYAWLMYFYFFMPGLLRRNLLLNLATHNPVIPLLVVHLSLLTAAAQGIAFDALRWDEILLFAGMIWSAMFAWEIARKIRAPQEENAYVTYSQILGRGGAVLLAFTAQTAGGAIAVHFVLTGLWPAIALLPLGAGYGLLCFTYGRFLFVPTPGTSPLRPFAEAYALLLMLTVILGSGVLS